MCIYVINKKKLLIPFRKTNTLYNNNSVIINEYTNNGKSSILIKIINQRHQDSQEITTLENIKKIHD